MQELSKHLESKGYILHNYGTDTLDSVDYPDFVHPVARDVNNGKVGFLSLTKPFSVN